MIIEFDVTFAVSKKSIEKSILTLLPKVIWERAALPPVVGPLTATVNNRLTVFARWRQCACRSAGGTTVGPSSGQSHSLSLANGNSIGSAVFPEFTSRRTHRPTDRPTAQIRNTIYATRPQQCCSLVCNTEYNQKVWQSLVCSLPGIAALPVENK